MSSTGEVACFGEHPNEAYLKAMMSSGFKIPRNNILLSVGAFKHKVEVQEYVKLLGAMGYKLYGSLGTADYFNEVNVSTAADTFNRVNVFAHCNTVNVSAPADTFKIVSYRYVDTSPCRNLHVVMCTTKPTHD